MKRFTFRSAAAVCAMSMLPVAAQAQVAQPDAPAQSDLPAQLDQAQPGQAAQSQTRPQLTPPGPPVTPGQAADQTYESRRVTTTSSAQSQQGVQGFVVQKLMLGNKCEIELGQLAQQKSQHPQVKEFAQKMVQDHQKLNQQLQSMASGQPSSATAGTSTQTPRTGQSQESTTARPALGSASSSGDLQQLTQLSKQAAETELQMVKQMLQRYQGQDFDMGYVGHQIVAHTQMLAHLQAIKNGKIGSPEFQQLVSQAEQKTNEHLDRATQLAMQLEDKEGGTSSRSGSTSNRPSSSQPAADRPATDRSQQGSNATSPRSSQRRATSDN